MIENSVVSLPPCWVALEVKAPPTLPMQRAGRPERAGLLPESSHGGGHAAEPRRRADDDRVVVGKVLDLGDRRGLVELEMRGLGDLLRHDLGDALDVDRRARGPRAFRFGVGHRLDMAVGRIVENKHLSVMQFSPSVCGCQRTFAIWSKAKRGLRGKSLASSP